ncbi:MAG: HD domain-containing protein [Bacteroidaceae bacterium]|nr:HD domain-containing protein [Bacteroidaceae bacterium]
MIHLDREQLTELLSAPIFHLIGDVADEMHVEAYVVGGYVRDLFLERPSKDIDVVVVGSGIEVAKAVARRLGRRAHLSVFKNFGTAQVKYGEEIEFVGARRESYSHDSRKPIVEDGTLEDDQLRRDFTINALAVCLNRERFGELVDPFDGVWDMEDRLIATPTDPDVTFSDDPLRMMRCIRFATQLNFEIEPETWEALVRNRERIRIISQERIIDEIQKFMASDAPARGWELLLQCGLLEIIFPELYALQGIETMNGRAHKDNFWHTLEVLTNVVRSQSRPTPLPLPVREGSGHQLTVEGAANKEHTVSDAQKHSAPLPHREGQGGGSAGGATADRFLWLRWAALLHDIGKPRTKRYDPVQGWTFHNHNFVGEKMVPQIFRRLKLPMDERMKYVQKLVSLHMRPIVIADEEVTDSAVRRLLFEAGDDIDDLMLLCEADITSKNQVRKQRFLDNFQLVRRKLVDLEERDRIRNFQPPVSGEEIMECFHLPPCREVGILKTAVKDAILDGLIPNEHDAALAFVIERARRLGLTYFTTSQGT